MKKVVNILSIIFVILLFYSTKNSDMLSLTVSFSMFILYNSIFSTTSIQTNNYKIFKYSLLSIFILGIPLTIISYLTGDILNIEKLNIINIFMTISVITNIIIKLTKEYLNNINYKKLSNNLFNIYTFSTLIVKIILTILFFNVFKTTNYINIILLYSVDIFIFIILSIISYILVFKKIKVKEDKNTKINIKEITNVLITNKKNAIYNLISTSYIYTSIIILYYILSNKYNYSYNNVSVYITNTYFYGLILIYYIHIIIKKYLNINIKEDFNNNFNKTIKVLLTIIILLTVISKPLSYLIVGSSTNILVNLIPLLFTYTIYDFVINTNMFYNKEKNIIIILVVGLIIKIMFEIPFINAIYRMGYSLALGDILSIVLGMIITLTIGIILIKKKLKLNLLNNFNESLNIIYQNIIYALVLILFTLIVKIDTNTIISSLLVIIFYIFITILFQLIRRILNKK